MRKLLGLGISAAAIVAIGLTPAAGWAATAGPAPVNGPAGGDPDTTVTFAVSIGALSMTAPTSANLGSGSGNPGTTVSGSVGPDVVTDTRAALAASWTVTVSSSPFTTGTNTPAETIPASDATYTPGAFTSTGTVTPTGTPVTLSGGAQTVVTGTGVGVDTVSWNPTEAVAVPAAAVGGPYTSTLTHSVS